MPARQGETFRQPLMGQRVARRAPDRHSIRRLGAQPIPIAVEAKQTESEVRGRQVGVQGQGAVDRFLRLRVGLRLGQSEVDLTEHLRLGQSRPGDRQIRIELDSSLQSLEALAHIPSSSTIESLLRLEIEPIGLAIHHTAAERQAFPLRHGELGLHLGRDVEGHFTMEIQDIGHRSVVGLGPQRFILVGRDQLHSDA